MAATALLGTLLAGVVLAQARFRHQSVLADHKLEAAHLADALLTAWWPDKVPAADSGPVDQTLQAVADPQEQPRGAGFIWRTSTVAAPALDAHDVQIVRLEILQAIIPSADDQPLVAVHLFTPKPPPPAQEAEATDG